MATCGYCHDRKGKRSCPALGGPICAPCCGKHRLAEIACPATCEHLGNLAVVRDPDATFTPEDYTGVWAKLQAYAGDSPELRHAAIARFFETEQPAEWEMAIGTGYLFYGHRGDDGRRLIDHFLAARGRHLPPGEIAAVAALQRAWPSLFEVTSVGSRVELRDLLGGDTVAVRDNSGTAVAVADLVFGWLLPLPDRIELTGAICRVPRDQRDAVIAALAAELPEARRQRPSAGDPELVGTLAWAVARVLRAGTRLDRDAPEVSVSYDARRAPKASKWQAIDDAVKLAAIELHHADLAPHPAVPDPTMHATSHMIVENQLAGGDPPETRETLARLTAAGLTRHEALHAIGSVVVEAIAKVRREGVAFDRALAVRQLAALTPEPWRFE